MPISTGRHAVLVVEDNAVARTFYRQFFVACRGEFDAVIVSDGETALKELGSGRFDVVILDWELPGMDGVDVVRSVRADPSLNGLKILIVTVKSESTDCVKVLESGADDYVSKPCDSRVLLARLHSLLRRGQIDEDSRGDSFAIEDLHLDVKADRVTVGGKTVRLNPKEFNLLRVFMRRPDVLHSSRYLWDNVWGYASKTWEHTLIVTLSSLRKKLGPSPWSRRLESRKGKGYILSTH